MSRSRSLSTETDPRVLLIEDEPDQRAAIVAALSTRDYDVVTAATGEDGLALAHVMQPDVILLDLGLPDVDGIELCRRLRVHLHCPVVVISADQDEIRIVEALDVGADDYVRKPFSVNELLARVRVALRHRLDRAPLMDEQVLHCGDVTIDVAAHLVRIGDEVVDLVPRQFELLTALVRNEGRVMTYKVLARLLWGFDAIDDHAFALRTAVSKLRRTLGIGEQRPTIETEFQVGYRLVAPPAARA